MTEQQTMTLAEALAAEATLKTLLDQVRGAYDSVRRQVQAGMDEQQKATGSTRFDALVPGATGPVKVATVSLSSGEAAAQVTDIDAFEQWVRETYPTEWTISLVRAVRPAWQTDLLARATAAGTPVDTETGETIPGVEMRAARARTHAVRFAKGGREQVETSWRAGLLGRVLPALAPADADTATPEAPADIEALRKRVAELEERDAWLCALEAAGVDNWSGMEHAVSLHNADGGAA